MNAIISRSHLLAPPLLMVTFVAITVGCNPFDSMEDVSTAVPLRGKCIELIRPLHVVRTAGPADTSAYLDDVIADGDGSNRVTVREGTTVTVKRVSLVRSFEDTQVAVVGVINGYDGDVWVNTLFTIEWRGNASNIAMRGVNTPIKVDTALKPEVAKWCN